MQSNPEYYKMVLDSIFDGVYILNRDRRIVYWNQGAERIAGFKGSEVIGRQCRDEVLMHVDEEGKSLCPLNCCPAIQTISDGQERRRKLYIRHKNGHRVAVLNRCSPLKNASGETVGAVEIFTDSRGLLEDRIKVEGLAKLGLLDSVTQVGNRKYAMLLLQRSFNEMVRYSWNFAVLGLTTDNLEMIEECYGRDAADEVLQAISRTVSNSLPSGDMMSHWAPRTLLAIIPHAEPKQVQVVGEAVRALVEQSQPATVFGPLSTTASVGLTMARKDDSLESLLARVGTLIYRSKARGGNTVTADDDSVLPVDSGSMDLHAFSGLTASRTV